MKKTKKIQSDQGFCEIRIPISHKFMDKILGELKTFDATIVAQINIETDKVKKR